MKMHMLTFTLLLIGGFNWLLVGLFGWDIGMIFGGQGAPVSKIVYILVGLSAVWEIVTHKTNCKACCGMMKCEMKGEEKPMQMPPKV